MFYIFENIKKNILLGKMANRTETVTTNARNNRVKIIIMILSIEDAFLIFDNSLYVSFLSELDVELFIFTL